MRAGSVFSVLLLVIVLGCQPASAMTEVDPQLRRLLQQAIAIDNGFEDRFEAEVWLLDMSRRLEKFVEDPATRIEILKLVHYEATRVGLEPELGGLVMDPLQDLDARCGILDEFLQSA